MVESTSGATIKRNLVFNTLGGLWVAAINLVSVPIQIRVLGPEAYGLIGFVATAQIGLSLLEFGLSMTVIREVASDTSPDKANSRALVQTASTVYWIAAALVSLGLIVSAGWLTTSWLTLKTLDPSYAALAIRLLALNLTLTWPVVLYAGALAGIQRFDASNVLRIAYATLSVGGGAVILLAGGGFTLFLIWLVGTSILATTAYWIVSLRLLPTGFMRFGISVPVLRRVWRFSLDMYAISVLTLVLTTTDRLIISKTLSLVELGYINLAYAAVRVLGIVAELINGAVFPALARDHRLGDIGLLKLRYERYSQMIIYLLALPAAVLIFFGRPLLAWITKPDVAAGAAPVMALMAFGSLLNGSLSPSYNLTVLAGKTRIPLVVNLIAVAAYLPILYFLIAKFGLIGAGVGWILLNLYYFVVFLPAAHAVIPPANSLRWLARNLLPFCGLAGGLFYLVSALYSESSLPALAGIIAATALMYAGFGYLWLYPATRRDVITAAQRVLAFGKRAP
jgi:O-antigen/teichoic acid export membrane protein